MSSYCATPNTSEEIDRGYILACQSVPLSNLSIEVDLSQQARRRKVTGRVIEQEKVTHDITRLTLQFDGAMPYTAGQFAYVCIDGLDGVVRSYSFATPARADSRVSFFVRKVSGGQFSSLVNDEVVMGRSVQLEGPAGDFWLRPGTEPILLAAGGSGLAPILAILEDAVASRLSRSATLLFGARDEQDLYALDTIQSIAQRWHGKFQFVPVLSAVGQDSTWTGERGFVTEAIPELLDKNAHVYLCGPPVMIDGALALLEERSVPSEHIHFDRFTTQADALAAADASQPALLTASSSIASFAGILHYLKYFLLHGVGLLSIAAILAGGHYVTVALLVVLTIYVVGDVFFGDDTSTPKFKYPRILTAQLWLALPLLALIVFTGVWSVCLNDPLGFGAWLTGWIGYDIVAARDATAFVHHGSTWLITGLMLGMVGTITAHELTHRTWDPISMLIGRWLLAFIFDTTFSIEHVYGHHRYVSTLEDPATAPRGRNVYVHVVASTIKGNLSAWRIEVERLHKKRLGVCSWHNAMIRGYLMSLLLVALAFAMGGWRAAAFLTICGLLGKSLLEIVNYIEHYGMVRNPETPVQPRHSWNTNRRISSWTMFNLTRHSHHHAQGEVPYQELQPYPNAPMMIGGYITTIIVALIPPLWHKLMTPKLLAWDCESATYEERRLAARANVRSGISGLQQATQVT